MAFPAENSAAERICKYLKDAGPATAGEIKEATGLSHNTTARAFDAGFLTRQPGSYASAAYIYSITPQVRDFLATGVRYQGEIVPHAEPRPFRPLVGYTASLTRNLREPIREISFMRTSSQYLPRQ